ncbi:MAG: CARDB domain-containing protein, partial [Pseudomonadota bacterium]
LSTGTAATDTLGPLNAGETIGRVIAFPPGPRCYTPLCGVTATVDPFDEIAEADETNNTASRNDQ